MLAALVAVGVPAVHHYVNACRVVAQRWALAACRS